MPDRVDAPIQRLEPPRLDPTIDHPTGQPEAEQLISSRHAVAAECKNSHLRVTWAIWTTYTVVEIAHVAHGPDDGARVRAYDALNAAFQPRR